MRQGGTAEVDQTRQLLGGLKCARLRLKRLEGLLPGQHHAHQQQCLQGESAPEQVQRELGARHQATSSGTKT
jgi:hypothetical protein